EVGVLLRFLPRAGRDLVGRLSGGLKKTVDLLLRLIEGVPDRRRRRCGHLELGNDAIDPSDVGIDGPSLVTTNRNWKRNVEQIPRHVLSEVAQLMLRYRRRGRRPAHVPLGRFAVDHCAKSMTTSRREAGPSPAACRVRKPGFACKSCDRMPLTGARIEFAHPTPLCD